LIWHFNLKIKRKIQTLYNVFIKKKYKHINYKVMLFKCKSNKHYIYDRNFLQPTYKKDICHLNMWEAQAFLLMLLKKHVRSTNYLNNMWFSHAKGHMSILYVSCRKFPTNRLVGNFCPYIYIYICITNSKRRYFGEFYIYVAYKYYY